LDEEDSPICYFTVDPDEALVVPDEEFCLPIYVKNVAFLQSLRFPLAWDPDVLTFTRVDSFRIEGLNQSNFDIPDVSDIDYGSLSFEYIHTIDPLGLVVADSTPIFSICFQATGQVGDSSLVSVSFPPEAIDVDGMRRDNLIREGLVKVAVDSTADCVQAIQVCSNEPISIDKSRGPGFEEFEAQESCSPLGEEFKSKLFQFDI